MEGAAALSGRRANPEMPRSKINVSDETWRVWRLLDPDISFGRIWHELNVDRAGSAASSTIDALMYALRRGPSALTDARTLSRLKELDERQLIDIAARLQKFKSQVASPWLPNQIEILVAVWRKVRR